MDTPSCSKDETPKYFYAIIRNIPPSLHSAHLRDYFSFYVENEKFDCFHFKHRPEKKDQVPETQKKTQTSCCVVRFRTAADRSKFINDHNDKNWVNAVAFPLVQRCYIQAIKIAKDDESNGGNLFTEKDLKELVELRPPALMPRGNVGTPTAFFMDQIRTCRLPPSIIKKLGLKTQKRIKKFGAVAFNYGKKKEYEYEYDDEEEEEAEKEKDQEANTQEDVDPLDPTAEYLKHQAPDNDEGADDDDDQCEEWERHEAIHNDVTEQDRTKERNYEPELELVWEKGGPGLVWHTDKNYWHEREIGDDCDWAWADDWDVDYSVYYEGKSAGTIDGRHAVEIREDQAKWAGKLQDTAFRSKPDNGNRKRRRRPSDSELPRPDFQSEYGSKLMKRMGWAPGKGLGSKNQGKVEPVAVHLEEDANMGREKIGLGYTGEVMQRTGFAKKKKYHTIASIFDKDTDQTRSEHRRVEEGEATSEILLRSSDPNKMKYRTRLVYPEE